MVARTPVRRRHSKSRKSPKLRKDKASPIDHAVRVIYAICGLAGSTTLVDDIRAELRAEQVRSAIRRRETDPIFNWLTAALGYQGIADQVAFDYMQEHGRVTCADIEAKLAQGPSCPRLRSYWHFHDCRYQKNSRTCTEPDHVGQCPLPSHDLRNGHLNQMAYSLFLFIRDVAEADLVGWIDRQLRESNQTDGVERLARLRAALIEPLRQIYGVSDKVLAMALSSILIGAPRKMQRWIEVGGSMISIDTLVHNFMHRTGILRRFDAEHPYGSACYRPGNCADIIEAVAARIDARQFNPSFPQTFPRFVQHAIWQYCSQSGLDVCNGNRIDDDKRCVSMECQARLLCDRVALRGSHGLE
jgi:hypothetical protein